MVQTHYNSTWLWRDDHTTLLWRFLRDLEDWSRTLNAMAVHQHRTKATGPNFYVSAASAYCKQNNMRTRSCTMYVCKTARLNLEKYTVEKVNLLLSLHAS